MSPKTALACLCLTGLLAGCGQGTPVGQAAPSPTDWLSQVQPFVDRPAPAYTPPPLPGPSPYPTVAPPCTAGQLRAGDDSGGAAAGNIVYRVTITNVSASTCLLSGDPTLAGLDSNGQPEPLHTTPGGTYFGDSSPADLAPGEHGQLLIGMVDTCYPVSGKSYRALEITLPSGRGAVVSRFQFDKTCDIVDVSSLGKPQVPLPDPTAVPGTPNALTASSDLDRTATPTGGPELDFIITLTNPSSIPIPLSPCPSYTMLFNGVPTARHLNCDHVTVIPAGASVRYAMRLALPAGSGKFAWFLNTPYPQPGVGTVVTAPRASP